jgi:putative endonuclease
MRDRREIGSQAEQVAASFLRRRGVRVIDRNVENEFGEIDLVAIVDDTRAAVEVRSRTREDPLDAFDWTKIDRVRRTARALDPPCLRIDLITVEFAVTSIDVRWLPDV